MGDQKKKRWAEDGRLWKMGPSKKKKKKMGGPKKKKDGETPIFFLKFFGAHLSPIPNGEWQVFILSGRK